MTQTANSERRPRVALYSHDAQGLGHIRRNLAIAHALRGGGRDLDQLLLTSAPDVAHAGRPDGCDIVSLPALAKDPAGRYGARHLSVGADQLVAMRSAVLHATLAAFAPDVLIVDKHPRGFRGELEPALAAVRAGGGRVVLGLRDVLDDATTAAREWKDARAAKALRAWYDEVWVYGDPRVHDPIADLDVPRRVRVRHTGYLAHGRPAARIRTRVGAGPYALAMVGAGEDGSDLARAFATAAMPAGHRGVVVAGPHMSADAVADLRRIAAARDDLQVVRSAPDAAGLIAGAAALVGMGGYNTVCEALAAATPMLVVPRIEPRREQLLRAEALARHDAVDVLMPDDLAPGRVGDWLASAVSRRERTGAPIDLAGLSRIPDLLADLVGADTLETRHVA
ncbi:glycosyltransferase family protein [Microbacterium karelineae]|uniref:glycosyltransferase family protein n=1 Tax=Microbacterium karelineae TaxID=2654283 RepID=UPI0012EADFE3|nr:glycosyl transferase family 28 [Microbacterium karelineae]